MRVLSERSEISLRRADDISDQIGDTPLIRLRRLTKDLPPEVEVYAKAEWFNPSGSVKDRPAWAILSHALQNGSLSNGRVLLDSTSGNMGIAYATYGAAVGVKVRLAIPANASQERVLLLRSLGAYLIFTDPLEGSDGARRVAGSLAAQYPERYYFADQYSNPANWMAHYQTTGPELLHQTDGRITHFIAGLGTSGTLVGAGRYLRENVPGVRLVAVQPDRPLHGLEGLKHLKSSPIPEIYDSSLPDQTVEVSTEQTYSLARRLAREEGLSVGISSAAAMVAGLDLARQLEEGVVVVLMPDSALKYLDKPLWMSS